MPYRWHQPDGPDAPVRLDLWPHRSLTPGGFAGFFLLTAALAAVPLMAVVGTAVLWFVLVPLLVAVGGVWAALKATYRTAEVREELLLRPGHVRLTRLDRSGERAWEANPAWVRTEMHAKGPVPHYLTLRGGGRTVEIGAFLSEDERVALLPEIERAVEAAR